MPDPSMPPKASSTHAYRWMAVSPGTTDSSSEVRASGPRSTAVPSPNWAATSAVTRWLAVAVVASTGVSDCRCSSSCVTR